MSDTVKLVIEIPKKVFEARKMGEISPWVTVPILDSVQNATPLSEVLDEIKGEITEAYANTHGMYPNYASGLSHAYEIINKHIEKPDKDFPQPEDIEPTVKGFADVMNRWGDLVEKGVDE